MFTRLVRREVLNMFHKGDALVIKQMQPDENNSELIVNSPDKVKWTYHPLQ